MSDPTYCSFALMDLLNSRFIEVSYQHSHICIHNYCIPLRESPAIVCLY